MYVRLSACLPACLSVCLSVTCIDRPIPLIQIESKLIPYGLFQYSEPCRSTCTPHESPQSLPKSDWACATSLSTAAMVDTFFLVNFLKHGYLPSFFICEQFFPVLSHGSPFFEKCPAVLLLLVLRHESKTLLDIAMFVF